MAPVAAAISAKSSGATKSARARSSPQSMEWPGPAMKPSSDIHRFTTTLPLMSRPPSLDHHRTFDLSRVAPASPYQEHRADEPSARPRNRPLRAQERSY